ncbi:MAG: DsbA family protein [Prevotella sp.]|nr:DsbA family protein [Prevotella sp.]
MKIVYWSDYACPYCYIGETRLKKAIKELGLENEVEIETRAFELDPTTMKRK